MFQQRLSPPAMRLPTTTCACMLEISTKMSLKHNFDATENEERCSFLNRRMGTHEGQTGLGTAATYIRRIFFTRCPKVKRFMKLEGHSAAQTYDLFIFPKRIQTSLLTVTPLWTREKCHCKQVSHKPNFISTAVNTLQVRP